MTPDLQRLLKSENLCYITTYDAIGKPRTVEIWFVCEQGKLYISTGAQSVKVKKLRVTPRARVAIGGWKGPVVEGPARLADDATVRRMVPVLSQKYNDYWGSVDTFTRRNLGSRPSRILIEVTPGTQFPST
ncbi:MAG: hypothetical protein EXR47_00080 [Dehalococcoidia bacterium]|nr:hypothetical protein [Dehalococcoidia bacterium]